jgi:hypothetical protein
MQPNYSKAPFRLNITNIVLHILFAGGAVGALNSKVGFTKIAALVPGGWDVRLFPLALHFGAASRQTGITTAFDVLRFALN